MIKIISKKEYNNLKEIKTKYDYLTGQCITFAVGGRSRRARLLQLPKEELVRIIFDLLAEQELLIKKVK